ncbi:CaiB/BaiF CoA-transferase family protein [Patulibacter sp.]|uniref:CaiB/BaiF CoA transferase family protein n=1 Tax=Patulibacter sp. TaxID=1912859 RepID=UPI002718F00D|nr:CaiB/BaiF CoA-transferase family protein [Patulibacter sp.]MDO9410834.1 CaiB/BaiF CoA-transferase family protein [Patulibacter sp.]
MPDARAERPTDPSAGGPLAGVRVIELAGIGPAPFGCMMLADMGADVVRVDRASAAGDPGAVDRALNRGRRSIAVDLKRPEGVEVVLRLTDGADVLVEGFRPGVAERLGVGPDVVRGRNPRLVYARMTGWGQEGPYAQAPGHDLNYLALSGLLHAIGRADRPVAPLNVVADFGGGGALLATGVLGALLERTRSGVGQTVDVAMVDGAGQLATAIHGMRHEGYWEDEREANLLDGGAHFYDVYATGDGRFVSVAAVEPQFYALLLRGMGIDPAELGDQDDRSRWPAGSARFAEVFATRTRDEWCAILEPLGACFAPVLTLDEAPHHAHAVARGGFVDVDGHAVPAPAPRYDRTPLTAGAAPVPVGADTDATLAAAGFAPDEVARLREVGAVA